MCTGTEAHLGDCAHADWGVHNCAFAERAGVRCTVAASGLTATPGDNQMDLAWDAPGNDAGITRHEVRYKTAVGSYPAAWTAIPDSAANRTNEASYTVTGLASGTGYTFQVRIVGGGNESEPDEVAAATTGTSTDATLSDLVVNDGRSDLTLTPTFASGTYTYTASVVSTVAEVTVTPTKNDSGATIEYLDESDVTLDDADTGVTGHQVAVAEGDTVIKVKVTAADGVATQTYAVTVSRAPAPAAPTNLMATAGDALVDLAWDPPASDSGITRHEFRYKTDGSYPASWTRIADSAVGEANAAAFTVTGLTNGTAYTFELRAVGAGGDGAGAEQGPVTPMAPSGMCTDNDIDLVRGSDNSEGSVQICHDAEWRSVCDDDLNVGNNGPAFAGVVCRQFGYATGEATLQSEFGAIYPVRFWLDDVVCTGTEAHLGDCAHADWGVHNCAFAERAGVRCTVAASGLSATPGDNQMDLAWDAPGNDAGITRHEVRYKKAAGSYAAWTPIPDSAANETNEASYTVTGLASGTDYTFQVRIVGGGNESEPDEVAAATTGTAVSTDATLSDLVVNDGTTDLTLTPGFASDEDTYTVSVGTAVAEVTVTPTPNDAGATIEYLDESDATLTDANTTDTGHQVAVAEGDTVIKVKVTAEDGNATQTYTVTVKRAAATVSTDATLSDLVVNDGTTDLTLTPTFASGMYTYTASVVSTVAEVTVTPTKNDSGAAIEYLDESDATLTDANTTDTGHQVAVAEGDTVIKVKVTAEDGNATQTYMVTVKRAAADASTDATLSDLVVNDGNMDLTLMPGFASSTIAYMASVGTAVTEVTVTPTPNDSGATIEYLDASDMTLDDADTGVTGHQVAVAVGDTVIKVKVTAADGNTTQTYTVTVKRPAPAGSDATLSALAVKDGSRNLTLRPGFAPGTTSYRVWVVNDVAEVTVTPTPNDADAAIDWLDGSNMTLDDAGAGAGQQVTLDEGDNVVKVKVTAKDGNTTRTYTVTVTRRAVDAPGEEGDLRFTDEESYTHPDGHEGVAARVEIFHAERWGTVCDDGFSQATTFRLFQETATSTVMEIEPDNDAPALVCQAMGYETGEYAPGYGRPGVPSQPSGLGITIYYPVGSTYPSDGPEPIWVDDMTCVAGDADLTVDALPAPMAHCGYAGWGLHNCTHNEDAGVRCWNDSAGGTVGGRALKARFMSPPEHHDGSGRVKVRVAFSEAIEESPENVGEHGVKVEGGRVTSVRQVDNQPGGGAAGRSGGGQEDGQEDGESVWEFEIEPGSDDDLTMRIDGGRPCDEPGAICTQDGRSLSEGIATTVEGPDPVPLTAAFEGLPEAHDGEEAFHFRVAFSEDTGIGFRSMRDDSFAVDGGEVTKARRVDGRHDLWEITVEPGSDEAMTIALPGGRECAVSGAICTRGENRRQLANTPAATVAGPVVEPVVVLLTASFVEAPVEHDGKTAFKLRIAFSEDVAISFRRFRDQALSVSGGSVTKAKRVEGRRDLWEVTVKPGSFGDVTVTLEGGRACGTAGAVCTGDGRALSATISTTVLGPAALSVADARVREAEDALLVFEVTLDRARHAAVTVDYVTSDVTARAGEDYTSASGTLTFATGERSKTVEVTVFDDAHDEGEETLALALSNPSGAYLADATATGTIENSDHMPKAWMVRFGRTVGSQVVDALNARLDGAGGSHVTVAGINLIGAPGLEPQAEDDDPFGLPEWAKNAEREADARTITGEDIRLRSAFHLSSGGDGTHGGGPAFTAWGRVATGGFEAEEDGVTMDGDVTTGLVGFDAEWERALAGIMLSQSSGDGSYRLDPAKGDDAGTVESSLTGVYPYARVDLNRQVSAWALAGIGSGELTLRQTGKKAMPTDISMRMGAVGVKGKVLDGTGASGVSLDVKTDAMWVGTKSERTNDMVATEGDVTRLRLILQGERAFAVGEGATFAPSAEVGLRHDGGDAETGTGVEVGAGLRYTAGAVTVEAQARTLLVHEASGYEDWGASGAIRVTPDASGRGLTLSIAPVWGRTGSAAERLWSARDARALGEDSEFEAGSRLVIDAGYGIGLTHRRGVLTPYAGFTLGDAGNRTVRTGTRWQLGPDAVVALEGFRQASDAGEADNQFMLRVALRF